MSALRYLGVACDDGILCNGNDAFRIWYNRVAASQCNQAGEIGGWGDGGNWYHELSSTS